MRLLGRTKGERSITGRLTTILAIVGVVAVGGAAWAYFTSTGVGSGAASVGALAAPTNVNGNPSGSTVAVSWTGVTDPGTGVFGYYVTRTPYPSGTSTNVCGSPTPLLPASPTSCSDSAVPNGTYSYTVTAVYNSFSSSGQSGQVVVAVKPSAGAPGVNAATTFGSSPIWVSGENVTLTDMPSANGGVLTSVAYYYCATASAPCTSLNWTPIGSSASGGTWSVVWPAGSLPADGTYDVVATASTSSLTSDVSAATEVGVDTTPPNISTPNVNGFA